MSKFIIQRYDLEDSMNILKHVFIWKDVNE